RIDSGAEGFKDASRVMAAAASGNGVKAVLSALKTVGKKNKKGVIGGAVGIGLATAITAGLFSILPLKVLSITQNLEDIFYSGVDDAENRMSDNLIRHYIIK